MRAAQRRRSPTATESGNSTAQDQASTSLAEKHEQNPEQVSSSLGTNPPKMMQPADQQSASVVEGALENTFSSITAIEQRQPSTELDENDRHKIAKRNIETLATALQRYFTVTKRLPQACTVNSSNLPTLSWRVALLPYLGHKDLHEQFDFSKPWNVEPNKSLIKYIPDAYVSPERFDTNTNYQLATGKHFIFGENRVPREKTIEDGIGNTLMLFEVNDDRAVPWTKPADLSANNSTELAAAIGGLREHGTFAAWANGLPVLLANTLSSEKIFHATTHESGEAFLAAEIHRDITDMSDSVNRSADTSTPAPKISPNEDRPAGPATARHHVPKAIDIAESQDKLRKAYADDLQNAKEISDKSRVGRQMLTDASKSRLDPTGAYVMQTAAMRLALEAGDIELLMAAIDQRVAQFEVDPYQENTHWIQQISTASIKRNRTTTRNRRFLQRVLLVAHISIMENDFSQAAKIMGIAFQFTSKRDEDPLPRLINKLKAALTTAESRFDQIAAELDVYRKNPNDSEAATKIGMFLCFTKGDWITGLKVLQEGNNEMLKELTQKDLQLGPEADPQQQAKLADLWWDCGELTKSSAHRQSCRDRSLYWYLLAYERLPDSLDRIHVKKRIQEAKSGEGGNLLALCSQLAREMSVELANSRVQIASDSRMREAVSVD